MKKLSILQGAIQLSKEAQKNIHGGGGNHCKIEFHCAAGFHFDSRLCTCVRNVH